MVEILSDIKRERKYRLGIVTNKPTYLAEMIIKVLGLEKAFEFIIGIDYRIKNNIGNSYETKREALAHGIRLFRIRNENCIYIGDTKGDMEASIRNGVRFIAATYGFDDLKKEELANIYYVKSPDEIMRRLGNMPKG